MTLSILRLFALLSIGAAIVEAQASWTDLVGTWTDEGDAWEGVLPTDSNVFHYGAVRLWTTPVNSDNYVITSRQYIVNDKGCGHVFKYKTGSVRTKSLVTGAWGYFLWTDTTMYITSSGAEASPKIPYSFSSGKWYTQKSVVNGTNVKIYIDDQLVKEITMSGEGADSSTDNYVGLWCHDSTQVKGDNFTITGASATCPRLSLSGSMTRVSPSSCAQGDSPVGTMCSFSCARGYRQAGPLSTNCTGNGTWTDQSANVTCEDVNECLTDNGGCSHSCTNAPGAYNCTCPDAINLGPDNHTCEGDGITVNCGKDDMSITLPKSLVRVQDRDHLRLLNTSCQATETASHYTLKTPLTGCDTTSRHTNATVVYSNKVLEMPTDGQIVRRSRGLEIPFSCYYGNGGVVSAVGLKPSARKNVFLKDGEGNFSLSLVMFPDERFTASFSNDDFPIGVLLGQPLYFQVSVTSADKRLSILADRCFATPTQDSNAATQYEFIGRGCSKDDTVRFHSPSSSHVQRFSLEAFEFIAENAFVFIHCEVKICNATDPNSECIRNCPSRRRRAAADQVPGDSGNQLYSLAQGPLFLEESAEHELVVNFAGKRASANLLLTAVLALLCVVCLLGTLTACG